jgi:acyl-coenzyme A thioesterase 13
MNTNENEVLTKLKAHLNKNLSDSPSPFGAWLNGILRKVELGTLEIEFVVRKEMTNTAHIMHGGAIAAIMDDTMGMTVASLGHDTFFTTLNLSIDYLSSAKEGDVIIAKTKINREGRHIVNIECEIVTPEGKLLSKGMSNLFKTSIPK